MGNLIGLCACPVCGNNNQHIYEEGMARRDEDGMWFIDEIITTNIECNVCGHNVYGRDKADALKKWNNTPASEWELNYWRKHNCDT